MAANTLEQRNAKDIKSKLKVVVEPDPSFVVVLAQHKNPALNVVQKIPTRRGIPIGGYVHDEPHDCYLVRCLDFLILGSIPVSYRLTLNGYSNWSVDIPIPETVVRRYLSDVQKADLKRWQHRYGANEIALEFVQMLGVS